MSTGFMFDHVEEWKEVWNQLLELRWNWNPLWVAMGRTGVVTINYGNFTDHAGFCDHRFCHFLVHRLLSNQA